MTPSSKSDGDIPATDSAWAWDLYWHADCLHSCVPVSNPAAARALAERWQHFFSSLPQGAKIVDLGTGNGAVISMAAQIDKDSARAFSLHGVDAAAIDPVAYVKAAPDTLSHVTFHPRTRMEALPFPDNSVTAVCGQYAIEYSSVEKTIAETIRILAPGGRFQFLVHARDSVLISRSLAQLDQIGTILESGLIDAFRDALSLVIRAESAPPGDGVAFKAAKDAFDTFNALFTRLQTDFQHHEDQSVPANFLEALSRLFQLRQRFGENAVLSMLDDMFTRLKAQAQRLRDLNAAALDDEGIANLTRILERHSAHVHIPEKAHSGKSKVLLGWWLDGHIKD